MTMDEYDYIKESIFRIGEVYAVRGREITIKVDHNKNLSHILYQGQLIKNVSVGSYLKIKKGFCRLVAKVESEMLCENKQFEDKAYHSQQDALSRQLIVKVIGYFENGKYYKGIKEVPLIGDGCFLLDNKEFALIHRFASPNDITLNIGHLLTDKNIPIEISIDKLFASHFGIFGNTGSGKSHTLAALYKALFDNLRYHSNFKQNAKFILIDFNGEYSHESVITTDKTVYHIDTRSSDGSKIPLDYADLIRPELLYILCSASEKTQQPFIKRALKLLEKLEGKHENYVRAILQNQVERVLFMSDRAKSNVVLDYFEQILEHPKDRDGLDISLQSDLGWHGKNCCYYTKDRNGKEIYFNEEKSRDRVTSTELYQATENYSIPTKALDRIIHILYIQLINDILDNRAMNEHIAPVINKLKSFSHDFEKVFEFSNKDFWDKKNLVVIDLNRANFVVKKMIPMLIAYKLYEEKKADRENKSSLNLIIDEAHNILSYESLRESESFKDFRLETFEEIIKEGRKFGVFLTLSSQRPSDISPTIVSQLHNYFIHRLVNDRDIDMIEKAVSYLDKISMESLPILPVGACILSGIIADLPVILQVNELPRKLQPKSQTITLTDVWMDDDDEVL